MFIQTEQTPNPAALKFLPGIEVLPQGSAHFPDRHAAAGKSPLASRLFEIEGVEAVFFGHDFISITKDDEKDWFVLKPSILGVIMEHFAAKRPVMTETATADDDVATSTMTVEEEEIVGQIKALLDTRVRPAVAQDGGDIIFHDYQDGVVYLHMQGACSGCPSSTMTLKAGIENMLRHYIPEVTEVRPVM